MLSRAPVALRWTRMSRDLASLVSGPRAPERAILALFSSWVARLVMQPTALHWTSTFGDSICLIKGVRPPSCTIKTLFSAGDEKLAGCGLPGWCHHTVDSQIAKGSTGSSLDFDIGTLEEEEDGFEGIAVDLANI